MIRPNRNFTDAFKRIIFLIKTHISVLLEILIARAGNFEPDFLHE